MRFLLRPVSEGGRGASPATANQRYRSISRFFKFFVELDEIEVNPMAKMSPPKVPEKLVPVVSQSALQRLFRQLSGKDFESRRDVVFSVFIDLGFE